MVGLEFAFRAMELIAALAGTIFITKYRVKFWTRYFVYFLWVNFFIEVFGKLPDLIDEIDYLSFLKNSFLAKNAWLYNIYTILSYLFYISFFKWNLKTIVFKKILKMLALLFLISSTLNLILTDVFFKVHSPFPMIFGTSILLISVFFYFFEMLKSERILYFSKDLIFYIAVGALIFHLCATPVFIYSTYYKNEISLFFVKIHRIVLYSAIIFMYTCYTIGFIVCSKKNKSY